LDELVLRREPGAHSWARNRPSLVMNPVRNTGDVLATVEVITRANMSSFQAKMKQISDVAAIPGAATGMMIRRSTVRSRAPSSSAASMISRGTSARNERIIQTAIGRFIEV
jgi:hypothetical protein